MRSRALLTAIIGWLLLAGIAPMTASAQGAGGQPVTADQLNRLSLEALTAAPPPAPRRSYATRRVSSGGYSYRSRGGYRSARRSYGRRSYARPRSYGRRSYGSRSYGRRSYGGRSAYHAPSRGSYHAAPRAHSSRRRR